MMKKRILQLKQKYSSKLPLIFTKGKNNFGNLFYFFQKMLEGEDVKSTASDILFVHIVSNKTEYDANYFVGSSPF